MTGLDCPDCGAPMRLVRHAGEQFFGCSRYPECRATHGADEEGRPLGVPGNAETRAMRVRAHAAFDPLWKNALRMYPDATDRDRKKLIGIARSRAYRWLAAQLAMTSEECHIGRFGPFECRLVELLCIGVQPEDVRAWDKARSYRKKVDRVVKKHGSEQTEIQLTEGD